MNEEYHCLWPALHHLSRTFQRLMPSNATQETYWGQALRELRALSFLPFPPVLTPSLILANVLVRKARNLVNKDFVVLTRLMRQELERTMEYGEGQR